MQVNEYPNMILISTINGIEGVGTTSTIPCKLLNFTTDDIFLMKDEMIGSLIETDIELNEIVTKSLIEKKSQRYERKEFHPISC